MNTFLSETLYVPRKICSLPLFVRYIQGISPISYGRRKLYVFVEQGSIWISRISGRKTNVIPVKRDSGHVYALCPRKRHEAPTSERMRRRWVIHRYVWEYKGKKHSMTLCDYSGNQWEHCISEFAGRPDFVPEIKMTVNRNTGKYYIPREIKEKKEMTSSAWLSPWQQTGSSST